MTFFCYPFALNAKVEAVLMVLTFSLTIYNVTAALLEWEALPLWALLVLGPLLGWGAVMLGALVLAWLRGCWWRWVNRRLKAKEDQNRDA